ncbi:E3 ubiquitin-protein ligase RHA2B-like [Momordica charantia]|uniref:E3 ubiquitin-protein ligase RHA2B-like n=1 Tax=Momordica charantia TaxID=3673 RepID=A0A6J1DWR6_MOMCH|nr:E3 ubiquitin-protein ligase RHA2B-like [Momordica charantia]
MSELSPQPPLDAVDDAIFALPVAIVLFICILYYVVQTLCCKEREAGEILPVTAPPEIVPAQIRPLLFEASEFTDGGGGECVICLCGYEEGEKWLKMKCGHIFHRSCIERWLMVGRHCPLCRSCLSAVVVHCGGATVPQIPQMSDLRRIRT